MILSSQGTLLKYQNNTWIKYSDIYPTIPDKNINFIKIDSKNNFWIGSNQGLFILKKDGFISYNTTNSKLPNDDIICIYVDSDNLFWIGTGDGLVHFDNNKWNITNKYTKNYDGEFFNIEQIIKDKNGIYWFKKHDRYYHGDDKFGPIYIDKYYLIKYKDTLWTTDSINNESNFLMLSDIDSTILIILPSMGILSYENNTWTNITFDNSPLTDFSVNYIDIDSKNTYWISTDRGLSVYNKSGITDKIILNRKPEPPTGLTSIQDKFNFNIKWCASTTKNVLYRIYRKTKNETNYSLIADNINDLQYLDVIPTDTLEFFYIVRAVSNDNGFESNNSIEISTHNIIPKIRYFNMGNTNIRSEQIYSISVDSSCTVWIGSWNGLCKNVSSTFTPLLCYPRIYKVCTNSDNSIWVLNDYDLLKFISKDSTNYKSMLHKQGINNFCFDELGRVIISINDSMFIFENDDWHQFFGLGTNNKKYKIIAAGINNKFIGLMFPQKNAQ